MLEKSGKFHKVLINTFYLEEKVSLFVKNFLTNSALDIELIKEAKLYGTGGTVQNVVRLLPRDDLNQGLFVAHADNLSVFHVDDFIFRHEKRPNSVDTTMMTFDTDNPKSCGIVAIDSESILHNMYEKVQDPPGNKANAAIYIFDQNALLRISNDPNIKDISLDFIPKSFGRIICYHNTIYHRDIGTVDSYRKAQHEFPAILKKFGDNFGLT